MNKTEYLKNLEQEVIHLRNLFNYAHAGLLVNYAPNSEEETKAFVKVCKTCSVLNDYIETFLKEIRQLDGIKHFVVPYIK